MNTTSRNRLDPSLIPDDELDRIADVFARPGHIRLVDSEGNQSEIPEVLFRHFARIVRLMSERKAIIMLPEDETFTTQAAANYLGVSRQHFVDLLEDGKIPFHKVGTHRRVSFKDLLAYEKQRDQARHEGLNALSDQVDQAGLYSGDFNGPTR